jgi:hypothetical protein
MIRNFADPSPVTKKIKFFFCGTGGTHLVPRGASFFFVFIFIIFLINRIFILKFELKFEFRKQLNFAISFNVLS